MIEPSRPGAILRPFQCLPHVPTMNSDVLLNTDLTQADTDLKMNRYEISFTGISFAAGTPGTRGVQLLNNTTVPSNEHIVNIFCSHISDSSLAIAYPFMAGVDGTTGKTNIYLNLYRASTSAVSGYSVVVRVITVPKMNT